MLLPEQENKYSTQNIKILNLLKVTLKSILRFRSVFLQTANFALYSSYTYTYIQKSSVTSITNRHRTDKTSGLRKLTFGISSLGRTKGGCVKISTGTAKKGGFPIYVLNPNQTKF